MKGRVFAMALVASALVASPAAGGDDREAQRTALYRDAVKAGAAGRWAEAKERLLAALALRSSPRVLFSLAQTEEHLGQVASAQADYARALESAALEGKVDVVRAARQAERALTARVPHVRAVLGGEPGRPGGAASATLDDRPMPVGTAVAVDPGHHRLTVSAPGMRLAVVSVKVDEGQQLDVSVSLEPDRLASVPAAMAAVAMPPPTPPARAVAPPDPAPRAEAPPDSSSQRTAALATTGVGVLALGAGVVLGVAAMRKHDEAAKVCPGATCSSADGARLWHDAVTYGDVSTIAFVAGGVGLAAGALLWLTAPSSNGDGARIGFGPGSVHLRGAW